MSLYHAELGFPMGFVSPTARVRLSYTSHALRACKDDRYAQEIPVFETLPLSQFDTVEVETDSVGHIVKFVVRGHWTKTLDLVFVLIPGEFLWTVKTVWINERNDSHKTLDRSRYVC